MKWAFGVGAVCSVAFAPSVYAVASFSASTNIAMSATADAAVTVSAVASVLDLFTSGNANATSSIGAALGDSVTADLLAGALTVNAAASGSVSAPPTSAATAQSFNDVIIDVVNTGATVATATLTFSWDQLVGAATTALGEIAYTVSDILFTDDLDAIVVDSFIIAIAANGTTATDVAANTVSVTYTLNPGGAVNLVGLFGFADAFGNANAVVIPEPTTGLLLLAGLAGLGYARRRSLAA